MHHASQNAFSHTVIHAHDSLDATAAAAATATATATATAFPPATPLALLFVRAARLACRHSRRRPALSFLIRSFLVPLLLLATLVVVVVVVVVVAVAAAVAAVVSGALVVVPTR